MGALNPWVCFAFRNVLQSSLLEGKVVHKEKQRQQCKYHKSSVSSVDCFEKFIGRCYLHFGWSFM